MDYFKNTFEVKTVVPSFWGNFLFQQLFLGKNPGTSKRLGTIGLRSRYLPTHARVCFQQRRIYDAIVRIHQLECDLLKSYRARCGRSVGREFNIDTNYLLNMNFFMKQARIYYGPRRFQTVSEVFCLNSSYNGLCSLIRR